MLNFVDNLFHVGGKKHGYCLYAQSSSPRWKKLLDVMQMFLEPCLARQEDR